MKATQPKRDVIRRHRHSPNPIDRIPQRESGKFDFAKIEKADSDGDGVSNLYEIKKGTNPGDPASK